MRRFLLLLCLLVFSNLLLASSNATHYSSVSVDRFSEDTINKIIGQWDYGYNKNDFIEQAVKSGRGELMYHQGTHEITLSEGQSITIDNIETDPFREYLFIVEPESGVNQYEIEFRDGLNNELVTQNSCDGESYFCILDYSVDNNRDKKYIDFVVRNSDSESSIYDYHVNIHRYKYSYYNLLKLPDSTISTILDDKWRYLIAVEAEALMDNIYRYEFEIDANYIYYAEVVGPAETRDYELTFWHDEPFENIGRADSHPDYASNNIMTTTYYDYDTKAYIHVTIHQSNNEEHSYPFLIHLFKKRIEDFE